MKIAPLAKIAAARKRLIEQTKEMKMTKIDVEALWVQTLTIEDGEFREVTFCRLIIEECARVADSAQKDECSPRHIAEMIRGLKP